MREGELVKVTLEIRLPKGASEEEVGEWLRFNLTQSGSISLNNPLVDETPEEFGPLGLDWSSTGMRGWKEEYGHEPMENGGTRYKVKYHREQAA